MKGLCLFYLLITLPCNIQLVGAKGYGGHSGGHSSHSSHSSYSSGSSSGYHTGSSSGYHSGSSSGYHSGSSSSYSSNVGGSSYNNRNNEASASNSYHAVNNAAWWCLWMCGYNHHNYDYNGYNDNGGNSTSYNESSMRQASRQSGAGTVFLVLALMFFLMLIGFCSKSKRHKLENGTSTASTDTKQQDLLASAGKLPDAAVAESMGSTPADGIYLAEYMEPATADRPAFKCAQEINLKFEKCEGGWKIRGQGKDADGSYDIVGGYVDSSGMASWTESGELDPTFVQVSGKFDFRRHTFSGERQAHNGARGDFLFFYHSILSPQLWNNVSTQQVPVVDAVVVPSDYVKLEDNIPSAIAQPVRPNNSFEPPTNPEYVEMGNGAALSSQLISTQQATCNYGAALNRTQPPGRQHDAKAHGESAKPEIV